MILRIVSKLFLIACLSVGIASVGTIPHSAQAAEGFYVGLNGGWNWARGGNSSTDTGGLFLNGTAFDIDADNGRQLAGVIGYKYSDLLRVDASYTHLKNKLSWQGDFKGLANPSSFTADTTSHILLLNGYLHGKGLSEGTFDTFDPFIGAGIGLVRNDMSNIVETFFGGTGNALPKDSKDLHPAIRVGIGVDTEITPSLALTSGLDAYWLGEFQTDDSRINNGGNQLIGAWSVDDVFSVGMSLGLRYTF